MTNITQYEQKLKNHDWFFDYSDSNAVWRSGTENEKALIAEALQAGESFQRAFEAAWELAYKVKPEATRLPWIPHHQKAAEQPAHDSRVTAKNERFSVTPKDTLDNWKAVTVSGIVSHGLIGRSIIFGSNLSGTTTEIVEVHVGLKRVRTRTGSIYQLGKPEIAFSIAHPTLVWDAGFLISQL